MPYKRTVHLPPGDNNIWKIFLEKTASGQITFTLWNKQINYHPREISCCFCYLGFPLAKAHCVCFAVSTFSAGENMRKIAIFCPPWVRMGLWPNLSLLETSSFEHGILKEMIHLKKAGLHHWWRPKGVAKSQTQLVKEQHTNSDHKSTHSISLVYFWSFSKPDSAAFSWNRLDPCFLWMNYFSANDHTLRFLLLATEDLYMYCSRSGTL